MLSETYEYSASRWLRIEISPKVPFRLSPVKHDLHRLMFNMIFFLTLFHKFVFTTSIRKSSSEMETYSQITEYQIALFCYAEFVSFPVNNLDY